MNILNLVRRGLLALIVVMGLGVAQLAFANAVTLVPTGFANGSEPFNVSVPTVLGSNPVPTGAFAGTLDGNPIVFFCFELTQSFSFTTPVNPYTYDDSVPIGTQFDMLSALFTEAFGPPNGATSSTMNSAAFQLAVWEILEEPTPKSLNTGADQGTFYVTDSHGNPNTVTAATNLIAGLPASGTYVIHLLHNETNQDFVYGVNTTLFKVPEPGPLALAAVALIAMLAVRRRVAAKPAA